MSLGSLTGFEKKKKKVTQQKNHNNYEFLNLMMLIQLDCSTTQRSKLSGSYLICCKIIFLRGRGKGRALMRSKTNRFNLEKTVLYYAL